jgi:hypothetical protein
MTDEERAELDELRAFARTKLDEEKAAAQAAEDAKPVPEEVPQGPPSYVHLADGRVLTTSDVTSHHDGVAVIGRYEVGE